MRGVKLIPHTLVNQIPCTLLIAFLLVLLCSPGAAQIDSLSNDEAAIVANIKALHSENSEVREVAATALRKIIAKYPGGTSNIRSKDGGEAEWMKKVVQVVPGMTEFEVSQILPPFRENPGGMGAGSGDSHVVTYRLDIHWMVSVQYRNPDNVIEQPKLIKRELYVYITPANNFTGAWRCWYVNGQKAYETCSAICSFDQCFCCATLVCYRCFCTPAWA